MLIKGWMILLALRLLVSSCNVPSAVFVSGLSVQPTEKPTQVESEPPMLYMLRGDVAYPMDRGSYCWITLCVDLMPPICAPEDHTWVIGHTLELLFDTPLPDTVSASLHRGSNLLDSCARPDG